MVVAEVSAQKKITPVMEDGWHVHDYERTIPTKIEAGKTNAHAPSDATVLFNGEGLQEWESIRGKEIQWTLKKDYMEIIPKTGTIQTKKAFGDMQLHVEWATPCKIEGKAQKRGNSGIFIMGRYEIQVLDTWENPTYADGMAGAVYGQNPPMVNAGKKPGEWQSYDIIFTAPRFEGDKLVSPAYVTVFHNGVLVQNHTELEGPTSHRKLAVYKTHAEKLPLKLQDHGQVVRYRNIWVRELGAPKDEISLFDGKTFKGWNSARNSKNGNYGPFSINEAEKAIHVYQGEENGSKQETDLLYTDVAYSNYILKFEYKWGEKKFKPRHEADRDAGLLFHVTEDVTKGWKGWPNSIEYQMGDSEPYKKVGKRWCTGDAWVIGLDHTADIAHTAKYYDTSVAPTKVGVDKNFQGIWTALGKEKPLGEWNEAMIKVEGGKHAYFFLNGKQVNELSNIQTKIDGKIVPLSTGRIGLQAEWSEVLYRNFRLIEIKK